MDASTLFYLSKIATAAAAAGQNQPSGNDLVNPYDPVFNVMADAYLRKLYSDSIFSSSNSTASSSFFLPSNSMGPNTIVNSENLMTSNSCNTSTSSTSSSPSSLSVSMSKLIQK